MATFTIIFTIFAIYMTGCCMDGPDLKPHWKRWLGMRLECYANQLKPIDYCKGICCGYYKLANETLPLYEKRYIQLIDEIARMNALNTRPALFMHKYDVIPIKSYIISSRDNIHSIEYAKKRCMDELLDKAKQFVNVHIDAESHRPDIVTTAELFIGKENKLNELEI